MKRTYQPNKRKRAKCHGFRARMATKGGRAVLARRRAKGRKRSSDISILFSEGRRVKTPDVMVIIKRNEKQHDLRGRVAFIAGKKLGNAVWRNRAKRRMRALCRDLNGPFPGYDVIFLARSNVSEADYETMLSNLRKALVKEKILQ